jgi:hypothetical protein
MLTGIAVCNFQRWPAMVLTTSSAFSGAGYFGFLTVAKTKFGLSWMYFGRKHNCDI